MIVDGVIKCDHCGKELKYDNKEANILICKECAEKISNSSQLFFTEVENISLKNNIKD